MKKLAIIGCGGIGSYHLEHFLDYTDVELAGFCDLIPERAESFAEKAGRGRAFPGNVRRGGAGYGVHLHPPHLPWRNRV